MRYNSWCMQVGALHVCWVKHIIIFTVTIHFKHTLSIINLDITLATARKLVVCRLAYPCCTYFYFCCEFVVWGSTEYYVSVSSGNGLVLNRRQTIPSTNGDTVLLRIYASLCLKGWMILRPLRHMVLKYGNLGHVAAKTSPEFHIVINMHPTWSIHSIRGSKPIAKYLPVVAWWRHIVT